MNRAGDNGAFAKTPRAHVPGVQAFVYPSGSNPATGSDSPAASVNASDASQTGANRKPSDETHQNALNTARADFERRLAEETRRSFETGREQGRLEGRQAERETQAGAVVAAERDRLRKVAELIDRFSVERDRYFSEVEREVVGLALAIAARILRREAQMDPLLLTGAVRVALGQLSASTVAQLVVPAAEFDLWKDAIAHTPNLSVKPEIVAGDGMQLGECMIKTDLGSVDIGLRSQLGEIERGFFDRVGRSRPSLAPAGHSASEISA